MCCNIIQNPAILGLVHTVAGFVGFVVYLGSRARRKETETEIGRDLSSLKSLFTPKSFTLQAGNKKQSGSKRFCLPPLLIRLHFRYIK
jgi:hypothetical protein